jgi:GTP cyclohydrolase I
LTTTPEVRADLAEGGPFLRVVPASDGVDVARAERAVRELLLALCQDPSSEELQDTPRRVALAYEELLMPRPFAATTFPQRRGL